MNVKYRFSGHESFQCRYTWLPKAYLAIAKNPDIFSDDNAAMIQMGVGKNMVKSIRFWVQAFGIAEPIQGKTGYKPTTFAHQLLGENGLDPYLEDVSTLWLLHWKISSISSITDQPLFAWHFLLNQWPNPDFSKSKVVEEFTKESERANRPLSDFTKEQHFDMFVRTYLRVKNRKPGEVLEDTLDSPFTELRLIQEAGERAEGVGGKKETVYEFRQDAKLDINDAVFTYCIFDYWKRNKADEKTLSFREISTLESSLGNLFKIGESDLRVRLEQLPEQSKQVFEYIASASLPRLVLTGTLDDKTGTRLLNEIYQQGKSVQPKKVKKATVA